MRCVLKWIDDSDGTWITRAGRATGRRFQITVREFKDGRVYDVRRLTRETPDNGLPNALVLTDGFGRGARAPDDLKKAGAVAISGKRIAQR
jgi:hypothetical protein